jgi:hypothetical protein
MEVDNDGWLPVYIYMLQYVSSYEDSENKLKTMNHWEGDSYVFDRGKIAMHGGFACSTRLSFSLVL